MYSDFGQIQVCRCYSEASRHCGSTFVGITLKEQPWEDGMWITVELNSCLWHVSAALLNPIPFFPFTLHSSLPFHSTRKTKGGVVGMQEERFHSAALKPLRM